MSVDWSMVATIAAPVTALFVIAAVERMLENKQEGGEVRYAK